MYIIKVLKRRDAASVIIAIWIALSLNMLVSLPTYRLANWVAGIGTSNYNGMYGPSQGWRNEYLNPVVSFVLQIIVLEILIRLFVWVHPMFVRKRK